MHFFSGIINIKRKIEREREKMKNKKKFFSVIISLFVIFVIAFSSCSNGAFSLKDMESQAKGFISKGEASYSVSDTQIQDIVIPISRILVVVGDIVVIIAITVIGIKYIMASPDNKAKLKTQLVGVLVATGVIFGAQTIWSIAYDFFVTM